MNGKFRDTSADRSGIALIIGIIALAFVYDIWGLEPLKWMAGMVLLVGLIAGGIAANR